MKISFFKIYTSGANLILTLVFTILFATPMQAKASAPLGDLTLFLKISQDSLKLLELGDLNTATKRITELETAWDQAEEKLQPMNPDAWASLDKTIDHALAKFRADKPNAEACKIMVEYIIARIKSLQED